MGQSGTPAPAPRRVALVAYFFPPLGGVAVARSVGFARHLPAAGWEPVVIAPKGSPYPLRDPGAADALGADLAIARAPSPEPAHLAAVARSAIARARGSAARAMQLRPVSAGGTGAPAPAGGQPAAGETGAPVPAGRAAPSAAAVRTTDSGPAGLRRVARAIPGRLRRAAWFPDDQAGWIPFAARAIVAEHRRSPFDVIVSSSSPVSAHVAAMLAARTCGIPWVADFRDPWLDNAVEAPVRGVGRWRRAVLERTLVRSATRCTFATPRLRAAYAARYPAQADRFVVVPNGYETDGTIRAAAAAPDASPDRPFRLVYAGSLYRPDELDAVLDGIGRFAARRPDLARRLAVRFIGTATAECRAVADARLVDPAVAGIVTFTGFVPRAEALAVVADADACLTTMGSGPGMDMFVGAKLFDYLAQDRQVFAVVPPGDARDLLAELGWGVVADPEPDAVADGLVRLLETPPQDRPADPDGRYRRSSTAARLARVLEDAAADARLRLGAGAREPIE